MLQVLVIESPWILTASISWCLSHKILKRMFHEILFRIVSWTRILCGFFCPMVRQRPKMKGTRFPVFADNLVIWVCVPIPHVFWSSGSSFLKLKVDIERGKPGEKKWSMQHISFWVDLASQSNHIHLGDNPCSIGYPMSASYGYIIIVAEFHINKRSPHHHWVLFFWCVFFGCFSPHLCVGFLFLILYPGSSSSSSCSSSASASASASSFSTTISHTHSTTISHTHLCHTPSFTHNHTPSFTRNFVNHHLWHTSLSHTIFNHHLSHTSLSHTIFHKHNHTPSFTRNFVNHHLSHTHLCQPPSFTHIFVNHHLSHTSLSHTSTWRHMPASSLSANRSVSISILPMAAPTKIQTVPRTSLYELVLPQCKTLVPVVSGQEHPKMFWPFFATILKSAKKDGAVFWASGPMDSTSETVMSSHGFHVLKLEYLTGMSAESKRSHSS